MVATEHAKGDDVYNFAAGRWRSNEAEGEHDETGHVEGGPGVSVLGLNDTDVFVWHVQRFTILPARMLDRCCMTSPTQTVI